MSFLDMVKRVTYIGADEAIYLIDNYWQGLKMANTYAWI